MAMLPFCGYNMGDYWRHWLDVGRSLRKAPHVFRVNWFRTGEDGRLLWPGFGENLRVLKWILERADGGGAAVDTAIGWLPPREAIDRAGLTIVDGALDTLLKVDPAEWVEAVEGQDNFLRTFGRHLPQRIYDEHVDLAHRIHDAVSPPLPFV
jgi:phosphoenolpyruvate carboxykinase (GTP)